MPRVLRIVVEVTSEDTEEGLTYLRGVRQTLLSEKGREILVEGLARPHGKLPPNSGWQYRVEGPVRAPQGWRMS